MIDIRRLREDPEGVKKLIASRGEETKLLDSILEMDRILRDLRVRRDETRAEIKAISKEIGKLSAASKTTGAKKTGPEELEKLKEESKQLGQRESVLEKEANQLQAELDEHLLQIPNLPAESCPLGATADDNKVLETSSTFDPGGFAPHQQIPHWDFAPELGILDIERAVKLSGSMFAMFRGAGARLANALIQLGLDRNRDIYEEIRPPSLVHTDTMISTGHLPKFAEEAYFMEKDSLWAIPTGEVPLTSLMAGEILNADQLPVRLMAYTPCYRREAGSAGAQTRGMLRVHEFDKVEILAYVAPEQAEELHGEILERAVSIIKELGLFYRLVDICTGDLGGSAARTIDVEVFAPGAGRWLECSSVSWFTDYQARRAGIRYRNSETKKTDFVHTVNGSAIAVPRVWAALVETHRQADGSIALPKILHSYMGGMTEISATGK